MFTTTDIEPFHIIGVSVETSNQDGAAARDIGALWSRFYGDNVARQIPGIAGPEVYVVYTDYVSDHQGMYTCLIGLRVDSLAEVPEGLTGRSFTGGHFLSMTAKGPIPDAIFSAWQGIWDADASLGRAYDHDFEVYGERSMLGDEAEVDIFVSIQT
jgi:predicted transcriptional regulator YdeE